MWAVRRGEDLAVICRGRRDTQGARSSSLTRFAQPVCELDSLVSYMSNAKRFAIVGIEKRAVMCEVEQTSTRAD